ncbi:MAG: hypothetical protein KDA58_16980, partial [Planctomycetaceae bacterium]|nr:hypothetical protein [Planctomycetaceae bacterium]
MLSKLVHEAHMTACVQRSSLPRLFCLAAAFMSACARAQSDPPAALDPVAFGNGVTVAGPGTDWPRFLGPAETGISTETNLLTTWPPAGPPLVWEKTVGTGYSAPSVLGDKLV